MRTREEIEEQIKDAFENHSLSVWEKGHINIQTELLLDIRDLLKDPQMEIIDELFTHPTQ